MATFYRDQVTALYEALQDDSEAIRLQAGEILRSLVKEIILTPAAGEMTIDVRGRPCRHSGGGHKNENPGLRGRGIAI